jgi:peptide/nickel transport system ATP-binding protein
MSAVEVHDVFRVYSTPEGDAAALQGLSLRVEQGQIVVVLGPSGSGKTTLLRLLAGLDRPSAGAVRVFGTDLARLPGRRLDSYRAETVGYVDQHYVRSLAPELTAGELVALQLGLAGEPRAERRARALDLLGRVGLEDRADAHPGELAGGEQQRVAVCAALAHRPRVLLADEPTGELDAANAAVVYRLIAELARELDCTTVIVSHDPNSAQIADRAISIRDGRVSEEAGRHARDETIVVGRGGWLRIPEELLARAGIAGRATAKLGDGGVVVSPAGERARPLSEAPSRRRRGAVTGEPVAVATGLAKAFGGTFVFSGLDASFDGGRLHAVTGPSGSGKTTLLHLLAGLELPDAGSVRVLGTEVSALGPEARADFRRDQVALVRQEAGLVAFLSARENLELALALRGREDGRPDEELESVGLAQRTTQRVSRLSAGEQTRVDIARALAAKPMLLLADEPTARLDQANALAVTNLLAALAAETGAAVVCATHDPIVSEQAETEVRLAGAVATEAAAALSAP